MFAHCDVGFATCALYRKKMDEACPLKVRDYLASGLAVVLPHLETALMREDGSMDEPDWVLRVPNRPGGLESKRDEIVSFCRRWRGQRVPRDEVAPLIDATVLERRRLAFLESIRDARGAGER